MSKKDKIKEVAIVLFSKKGIKATTIKDIAQAAKITEGAIYKHFLYRLRMYVKIQYKCEKTGKMYEISWNFFVSINCRVHIVYNKMRVLSKHTLCFRVIVGTLCAIFGFQNRATKSKKFAGM